MIAIWNNLVNKRLSLEGEFGNDEGYFETLTFESGNERTYLKNSYVKRIFPSLGLILDNKKKNKDGKTEFHEFENWFNVSLRYGTLQFYFPRIGFIYDWDTEIGEIGVYTFIADTLRYEGKTMKWCTFGLKEHSFIPEQKYEFLSTEQSEALVSEDGLTLII